MFKRYTQKESHFVMNAHFVNSEQIYVNQNNANASWLMLQTSTFQDGRSHLNAAKLKVKFKSKQMEHGKLNISKHRIFSVVRYRIGTVKPSCRYLPRNDPGHI